MVNVKKSVREQIKEEFKKVEKIEAVRGKYREDKGELVETNYPKSVKRHFLVYENFGTSVEENYFWIKDVIGELGFVEIDKIVDTFTASEQSTFFGSAQQRLAIQQDRVTGYLATIGKMVREMFQIVRDIQLLDEREIIYTRAAKGDDGAEKTLKGIWIDFVDNGPQGLKASSVYGLASQVGYHVLPHLFFSAPAAIKQENVSGYVKSLDYNESVKTALVRKLEQFVAWRDATSKQISAKKKFTISYLRQHYNSIKLYIDWVKPYLRNVKRLAMNAETQLTADVIGAFEGSVVEVELLAKRPPKKPGFPRQCILVSLMFRTRPVMTSSPDYQHKGPMHIGRMEMGLRGYAWTDKQIEEYKKIKMEEDIEMLGSIDKSIKDSMDYLGEDLKKYLGEFGEKFGEEEKMEDLAKSLMQTGAASTIEEARQKAKGIVEKEMKKTTGDLLGPFADIFKGFVEIGKSFMPSKDASKKAQKESIEIEAARKEVAKDVAKMTTLFYTLFKKARRLIVP